MKCEGVEWLHRAESSGGTCQEANEPSGSIEGVSFLDQPSDCQLL